MEIVRELSDDEPECLDMGVTVSDRWTKAGGGSVDSISDTGHLGHHDESAIELYNYSTFGCIPPCG